MYSMPSYASVQNPPGAITRESVSLRQQQIRVYGGDVVPRGNLCPAGTPFPRYIDAPLPSLLRWLLHYIGVSVHCWLCKSVHLYIGVSVHRYTATMVSHDR